MEHFLEGIVLLLNTFTQISEKINEYTSSPMSFDIPQPALTEYFLQGIVPAEFKISV